ERGVGARDERLELDLGASGGRAASDRQTQRGHDRSAQFHGTHCSSCFVSPGFPRLIVPEQRRRKNIRTSHPVRRRGNDPVPHIASVQYMHLISIKQRVNQSAVSG